MKYLLVFVFLFFTVLLPAQNWLSEGQTWEYEMFGGWDPSLYGKMVMQVKGDTIFQGVACKQIVSDLPNGQQGVRIAYEEEERVYVYDNYWDEFVKIYDFSLVPGDTIDLKGGRKYVVDSVGTIQIAQADRKFQVIRLFGYLESGTYYIVEGLGLLFDFEASTPEDNCSFFFTHESFCSAAVDGRTYRFRCFSESNGSYDPFGLCTLSSNDEVFEEKELQISPNPVYSICTISLEEDPAEEGWLEVYDTSGRLILKEVKTFPVTISTGNWPAGFYVLQLRVGKRRYTGKLLKL